MTGEVPAGQGAADRGAAGPESAAHGAAGHGGGGPAEIRALAVTVSNRAAAGVYEDRSGPVLARLLAEAGCTVDGPLVVPDGSPVELALREAIMAGYHVVVTRQFSYVVSTVMARHIERELDRWPRPRWITFVDVAGGRVKVRRELIECLEQSSTETRALWRLWRKQRDNEVPAEFD